MTDEKDNPFERFDLDPREGPAGITARMRELVEDASEAERAVLRAAWEELTLHPLRRLRAAIGAHPRHPALDRTSPARAPSRAGKGAAEAPELADLVPRPSIAYALSTFLEGAAIRKRPRPTSLDGDPVLASPPRMDHDPRASASTSYRKR